METMNTEEIKEHFINYTIKQSHASHEGNGKKANQYHKKIWELYHRAKEQNCIEIFKEFLDNPNENTRIWAAGFSYRTAPKSAIKVLKVLSKSSDPMIWLSVKATLESFDNGEWKLLL